MKLKLRRVRRIQLNARQRRNFERTRRHVPNEELEAFYYYTDPRTCVVPRKR